MIRLLLAVCALLLTSVAPAAAQATWPPDAPGKFALAIIDVETTGLDPAHHEMIDMGAIYTDLDGRELGRFFVRIMPPHPERLSPGAKAVNGFDVDLWKREGAVSEAEAVAQWRAFHARVAGDRTILFIAYNAWFDQNFTTALLARNGAQWRDMFHYHVLDIPSMAWGMGLRDVTGSRLAQRLGIPEETRIPTEHTGITGAQFNVDVYRALLARGAKR